MVKRLYLFLVFLSFLSLPSKAVLQEDSLKSSLSVLRHELIKAHLDQTRQMDYSKFFNYHVIGQLKEFGEGAAQVSLMLYSQNTDNIFDLTYACEKATNLWKNFQTQTRPFEEVITRSNEDIARYDSLINVLSTMYTYGMDKRSKIDRNVCLTLSVSIRRMLRERNDSYKEYIQYYNFSRNQLQGLYNYAQQRYAEIQKNIFLTGSSNYLSFLKSLRFKKAELVKLVAGKYKPQSAVQSQWDVRWLILIFSTFFFYLFIAIVFNIILFRFVIMRLLKMKKLEFMQESFLAKRRFIIITSSIITFGIILLLIRTVASTDYLHMATGLWIEYVWLLAVIFGSLLLRVSAEQIKHTNRLYYALIFVGFVVIGYRISMIPATLVILTFPIVLLVSAVWQALLIYRDKDKVSKSDLYLAYISQAVFVIGLVCAWIGYTFLAVEIIIWWMMQETCILTLVCIRKYLDIYRERRQEKEMSIRRAWLLRFIYFVILPTCQVLSFLLAVYWAANVFNLGEITQKFFLTNIINNPNFKIGVYSLTVVIILWFVFNYLNHTIRDGIKLYLQAKDPTTAESRSIMFINVIQVVVWGSWLLIVMSIFDVSSTWLVVVSGGLSTGIGFAMKDILENIYYGISLMAGRIKIGDYIVCDDIRGTVTSISYTSTMIDSLDGSIIALQNSQLFTKNFRNMTKNHGYELDKLTVGVAYGTNIKHVQKLLIDAISQLPCVYKKKPVRVRLNSFDDNCLTLNILVWVNVMTHWEDDSIIMSCIYETLNENGIEIPFPQRDIYIKTLPDTIAVEKEEEQEENS